MNELTRTNLIVNPNETTPSLQCPICLDLVIEPFECEECGKIFCKECITSWLNNSPQKECPNKHKYKKNLILDDWISNTLKKIYIKCPYNNCYSQYAYNAWFTHVKVCRRRESGIRDETPTGEEVFVDKEIQFFVKDLQDHNYLFKLLSKYNSKRIKRKNKR